MRRPKKLIATGWDQPTDAAWLRAHIREMEKRPFDGVVINLRGRTGDGKPADLAQAFSDRPFQREWLRESVADLRACEFRRFTDNFLLVGANPGNVDWFDDAGWKTVVEHWRMAAWAARESGAKGILFDPEPYTPPHSQFAYAAQPARDRHSFDDYGAKVRERGRQVMEAVAAEDPGITVFCYFMNMVNASATRQEDPRRVLEPSGYGLLPAFFDGWLDTAPPSATFVDGCEMAYTFNSELEYLAAANRIRGDCQELVSPANRARYRAQVQVSFGIYLDAYINPKTSPWHIDPRGGLPADRLRANVQSALGAADQYVWVYGEKCRWWPGPGSKGTDPESGPAAARSWTDALPGCDDALRYARDPRDYAVAKMAELAQAGKLVNLARGGDFGQDRVTGEDGQPIEWKKDGPPAGWHTWQDEKSKGMFSWDREAGSAGKGSARAAGVANGCFLQGYEVKPGERYAVQAFRRLQGRGEALVVVRWQTAKGEWLEIGRDVTLPAPLPRGQWTRMVGVAEVPEGARRMLVLLLARGQASAADAAWFDDVCVVRLN